MGSAGGHTGDSVAACVFLPECCAWRFAELIIL